MVYTAVENVIETKWCYDCDTVKPVSEFYTNVCKYDGLCSQCKICQNAYRKQYRKTAAGKANRKKEYIRHYNTRGVLKQRLKKFGMTLEQHQQMYAAQGGCCDICRVAVGYDKICLDHDHETGKARGMLCCKCNTMLAGFDDKVYFAAALKYIEKHGVCA